MSVWRIPVKITFNGPGSPGYNVWHFRGATGGSEFINEALAALGTFYTDIKSFMPGTTTVSSPPVITSVGPSPQYLVPGSSFSIVGTSASPQLPMQTAICVTWYSNDATRSGRGRTFISPVSEAQSTDAGVPEPAAVTALKTAAGKIVTYNQGLNTGAFGIWSQKDGVLRDIVRTNVRPVFATLRSRRD